MPDVQVIIVVALMGIKDGLHEPETRARIKQAKLEAEKYDRPVLFLCGGYTGSPNDPAESTLAEKMIRDEGLADAFGQIYIEASSHVSLENATYVVRAINRLLEPARLRIIIAVSSARHIRFFDQMRMAIDFSSESPCNLFMTSQAEYHKEKFHREVMDELKGVPNGRIASGEKVRLQERPFTYVKLVKEGKVPADSLRVLVTPYMLQIVFVQELLRRCRDSNLDVRVGVTGRSAIPGILLDPDADVDVILSGKINDEPQNPAIRFIHLAVDRLGILKNAEFRTKHPRLRKSGVELLEKALEAGDLVWPLNGIFSELLEKTVGRREQRPDKAILVDSMQVGVEVVAANLVPACMLISEPWRRVAPKASYRKLTSYPFTILLGCFLRRDEPGLSARASQVAKFKEIVTAYETR